MKIVNLELKRISVTKFSPRENEVELFINFNDGSDKEILKSVSIGDNERAAEGIVNDLRRMQKNIHSDFDGESIVEGMVNIVVLNEGILKNKISNFLDNVSRDLEKIKNANQAEGYLDLIRKIKGKTLEL